MRLGKECKTEFPNLSVRSIERPWIIWFPDMGESTMFQPNKDQALLAGLEHMESALGLLDSADAPAELGARLDGIICQLKELLASPHAEAEATEAVDIQPAARPAEGLVVPSLD